MDANELRALADALDRIARTHAMIAPDESETQHRAADYLLACADEKAVGYVTANGLRSLRQDDATVLLYAHDYLIRPDHVALYTHPAPAVPQAEPIADSDSDADYWLRNRQAILDAIERAGFMLMSNAGGFWLHPRGKTEAQAEPKREPLSDEQIASVCVSYRHDFGLLSGDEQAGLMLEARAWERAFRKEWQRC